MNDAKQNKISGKGGKAFHDSGASGRSKAEQDDDEIDDVEIMDSVTETGEDDEE